jgi:DNA-binding CsgD family transcriptional regulator
LSEELRAMGTVLTSCEQSEQPKGTELSPVALEERINRRMTDMGTIFRKLKNFFSDKLLQGEALSIRKITKNNFAFFMSWVLIILRLDCYILPIGEVKGEYHNLYELNSASLFFYLFMVATAVFICVFDVKRLLPYVKYSTVIVITGILVSINSNANLISYIGIVLSSIALGHIFASAGYGFYFILNNSEKLYSICTGILLSRILHLFKMKYVLTDAGSVLLNTMQFAGFIPVLVCSLFYRNADACDSCKTDKNPSLKHYIIIVLAFIVFMFNAFFAQILLHYNTNRPLFTPYSYHAAGVLLGIIIIILTQKYFYMNTSYVLNLSFAILALGFSTNILSFHSEKFFLLSAFLFGVSYSTGFISIYYITGIIVKRLHNMTFYRIGVSISIISYLIGFLLASLAMNTNYKSLTTSISFISTVVIMVLFSLTPLLTKTLYSAEWTDDLHRTDVTYENRLTIQLRELKLSKRETEVCILLLNGNTMRQIASMLNIAYSTVNTYYTSIYRKLGVKSRTELLVKFGARGVVSGERVLD